MAETEHDGFWSALEALGGQFVPPSLKAAVAETREEIAQLELKFDAAVEKVEDFFAPAEAPAAEAEPPALAPLAEEHPDAQ